VLGLIRLHNRKVDKTPYKPSKQPSNLVKVALDALLRASVCLAHGDDVRVVTVGTDGVGGVFLVTREGRGRRCLVHALERGIGKVRFGGLAGGRPLRRLVALVVGTWRRETNRNASVVVVVVSGEAREM
jgi:hypothetical protein